MLGPNARPILRGEEEVRILVPPRRERKKRNARNGSDANPVGDPLFDALRTCRRELAQEAGVPPPVWRGVHAANAEVLGACAQVSGQVGSGCLWSLMRGRGFSPVPVGNLSTTVSP